jgi:hypothetical protein
VELVKAAQAEGVPAAVCIASWDNLTNKGLLRVEPDAVIVWNQAQRREAIGLHGADAARVVATGAQPFDRWFARTPSTTREAFCRAVGLPDARPFVLFTCSSSFIAESNAELAFVRRWIASLRAEPSLAGVGVLVRPHPYNCQGWAAADLSDLGPAAIWPREPFNPIEEQHRDGFFDSLFHSAAVVGVNTSAMIEAAILGRPVLTVQDGQFAATQEGTLHFQHLLPENGGFLRVARSLDEHLPQLMDVLADPDRVARQTAGFVASFIRPHGADRPATPQLVEALERVARTGSHGAKAAPAWAPAAWLPIFAVALYAYGVSFAADPKVRGTARKRVVRFAERTRKRLSKAGRQTIRRLGTSPARNRQ